MSKHEILLSFPVGLPLGNSFMGKHKLKRGKGLGKLQRVLGGAGFEGIRASLDPGSLHLTAGCKPATSAEEMAEQSQTCSKCPGLCSGSGHKLCGGAVFLSKKQQQNVPYPVVGQIK